MKQYKDKQELLDTIHDKYQKYIAEFEEIPEELRGKRIEEVDRTPSENLSYQLGWINLLLNWNQKEQQGIDVQTPAEGYKWNNLGGLYQSFYATYGKYTLAEQLEQLSTAIDELDAWLETLTGQELFEPKQRKWATTKAEWPVWKWVHINTVAPFTNFRPKIRKWKKLTL
ncbi:MAG: ClbS/DfsB family four-helix bundle protein [Tetragenococcus koreensis]|nr:ClbS/DfsB family four-helix bundle protein [Tetragenococcus koreensis]